MEDDDSKMRRMRMRFEEDLLKNEQDAARAKKAKLKHEQDDPKQEVKPEPKVNPWLLNGMPGGPPDNWLPPASASAPAWQAQATAAGWRAPNSAHEMALALLHEPAESTSAHELALGLLNRIKMERDVETVESMDADRGGAWWREQEPADESAAQDEPEPAETFLARIAARGDELQGRRL